MSLALIVTNRAEQDLREIWRWSYETFGEAQADRYLDELERVMRACAASPAHGRSRDDVRKGYRSRLVGKHLIFYTHDDVQLIVQRVLHAGMDHLQHIA